MKEIEREQEVEEKLKKNGIELRSDRNQEKERKKEIKKKDRRDRDGNEYTKPARVCTVAIAGPGCNWGKGMAEYPVIFQFELDFCLPVPWPNRAIAPLPCYSRMEKTCRSGRRDMTCYTWQWHFMVSDGAGPPSHEALGCSDLSHGWSLLLELCRRLDYDADFIRYRAYDIASRDSISTDGNVTLYVCTFCSLRTTV